jgi:hypothetical protein
LGCSTAIEHTLGRILKLCKGNQGKKWFLSDSVVRTLKLCCDFDTAFEDFYDVGREQGEIGFLEQLNVLQRNMADAARQHLRQFLQCFDTSRQIHRGASGRKYSNVNFMFRTNEP